MMTDPIRPTNPAYRRVSRPAVNSSKSAPRAIREPHQSQHQQKPNQRFTRKKMAVIAVAVILSIITFAVGWQLFSKSNPQETRLVTRIRSMAEVPQDEIPTVQTITDKNKATQAFLQQSEDGDKLVLFVQSKIAVLYRPSTDRIVALGPIELSAPTVFLRNGTNQDDVAALVDKLAKAPEEYRLLSRDKSAKDYTQTLVVDLSGVRPRDAQQLAATVGGIVAKMPEGESRPEGELLIIIGYDQFNR